jgi:hypothetical protein
MTISLTVGHVLGFFLLVYAASFFASGVRLLRLVFWIALWQLFTPVRPLWIDIPMLLAGWLLLESIFSEAVALLTRRKR